MRKKTYNRMVKQIHKMNEKSPLSTPILIKRLKPLEEQKNYNPLLKEWSGPRDWEIVAETSGIFDAFKQSEEWREIGMLDIHDYKCSINDNLPIDYKNITQYIVERVEDKKLFNIVFHREFIGEVHLGLRPAVNNEI